MTVAPYYADDSVTIYHGDCIDLADVWLGADVLVTDPPYGISRTSGNMRTSATELRRRQLAPVTGDRDLAARDGALGLWGDRPAVVFGNWRKPRPARTTQRLIWHKKGAYPGLCNAAWYATDEEIYVLGSAAFSGPPTGTVYPTSELRGTVHGEVAKLGHPTPKPVGLMAALITKCPPGVIADPFTGAGATLIAAKQLGRQAIGVEIEERYCEIAAKRCAQEVLDFGGAT